MPLSSVWHQSSEYPAAPRTAGTKHTQTATLGFPPKTAPYNSQVSMNGSPTRAAAPANARETLTLAFSHEPTNSTHQHVLLTRSQTCGLLSSSVTTVTPSSKPPWFLPSSPIGLPTSTFIPVKSFHAAATHTGNKIVSFACLKLPNGFLSIHV